MQYVSDFAAGFMKLFQTGGKTFISWMTSIVPVVLLLLVLMNTIIAFIGKNGSNGLPRKRAEMY